MSFPSNCGNLTLIPASQILFACEWKLIQTTWAPDATLFVVPDGETPLKQSMQSVAARLRAGGHPVVAIRCGQRNTLSSRQRSLDHCLD
jgi:hypothetical protein